jgi:Ca-activated chloride channel family protein
MLERIGSPALVRRLTANVNTRGRLLGRGFTIAALALAIVALARPQWGESLQTVEREGVQIIIALDVSRSMLAEDVKPSRLVRAKLEIADLMQRLQGDEVGLVLFSGAAFLQFPLTFDYLSARNFIENANTEMITRQGTNIAQAIEVASRSFSEELISQKVILIITDGENQDGNAVEAAREAYDDGTLIYTIGVGTADGEPIPLRSPRGRLLEYVQDRQGNMVFSRLDENMLRSVAEAGGGKFIRLEGSTNATSQFTEELAALEKASVGSEIEATKIERFQIFAFASILLLIAGEVIPDRRRNRERTGRNVSL